MPRKCAELGEVDVNGEMVSAKSCRTCGVIKPLTDYHRGDGIGGHQAHCKSCRNESRRLTEIKPSPIIEIISDNGEVLPARPCTRCGETKPLNEFNIAKLGAGGKSAQCRTCNRQQREDNREKIAEGKRRYSLENREKIAAYHRSYYESNSDYVSLKVQKWYRDNRERARVRSQIYYEENREEVVRRVAEWRRRNPVRYKAQAHRRYALENLLRADFTEDDAQFIYDHLQGRCALTGSLKVDLDHFIPLAWGHGGTYVGNVYLLESRLNCSKSHRNPFQWVNGENVRARVDMLKWADLVAWLADLNGLSAGKFRDFVYWCDDNRRSLDDLQRDGRRSIDIWRDA